MIRTYTLTGTAVAALALAVGGAFADTISPEEFAATLALGQSVTIEKTVVVEAAGTTSALIDSFFLIDTSGSMGGAINNAKLAAGELLAGLEGFGDNASGVGVFSESATGAANAAPGAWINQDIATSEVTALAAINAVTLGIPDFGGDFPERGQDAVAYVAENASWRPGSNRFIFALGDASWKNDITSDADALAALTDNNVTLIGLRFSNFAGADPDSDDTTFTESVEDLGGTVFSGGTSAADIIAAVTAGITGSFENYSNVTVSDLGGGLPGVTVTTVCTFAGIGVCDGALAEGAYDRSEDRIFTFDVTFTNTGLAPGESVIFPTFALVNGGVVATELDTISAPIPLPAAAWLLLGGLGGLAALRRRKA